jgi:putative endonuclease
MFYIYILYSPGADVFYVGHSDDPFRRLDEHNSSDHVTYTSKFRPWVLKAIFKVGENRNQALIIERFIKKQKSRNLIIKLIDGLELTGILAQLVIPYVRDAPAGLIRGSLVRV